MTTLIIDPNLHEPTGDAQRDEMLRRMAAAKVQRDEGMAQALDHAERDTPSWGVLALMFLKSYANTHRQFTSFDLRNAAKAWGLVMPPTDKAFGPVFVRAAKEGVIRKAGYAQHPERHASPTVLWDSLIARDAA